MKNLLCLAATAFLLLSCKDSSLHNSFIYFSEAQPTNVETITMFPKKYLHTYSMDYAHQLIIKPKCIYLNEIETVITSKLELDSLPELELRNNQVYDTSSKKAFKTFIKGDSISFEIEHQDTLFSFAENEIAKEYKSALILNKKVNNHYQTSIIKFSNLSMHHIQLGTKKDFVKINNELKIPFQTLTNNTDTLYVIVSPSRADFRKLLRKEGFEYQSNYLFR